MCVILIFFLLKTKLNYLPESVACVIVGKYIGSDCKILYDVIIFHACFFFLLYHSP